MTLGRRRGDGVGADAGVSAPGDTRGDVAAQTSQATVNAADAGRRAVQERTPWTAEMQGIGFDSPC